MLTNAKLKVVVSIFGLGFQRHQRLTVKRNPSDVITSCLVLTNAKLKVVESIFGIGFQRHQRPTKKEKGQ